MVCLLGLHGLKFSKRPAAGVPSYPCDGGWFAWRVGTQLPKQERIAALPLQTLAYHGEPMVKSFTLRF